MSLRYTLPLSVSFNNGVVAEAVPISEPAGHCSAASCAGGQRPSDSAAGFGCIAAETSTCTCCSAESVACGTISVSNGGCELAALTFGSSTEVYTLGANLSSSHARAWNGPLPEPVVPS